MVRTAVYHVCVCVCVTSVLQVILHNVQHPGHLREQQNPVTPEVTHTQMFFCNLYRTRYNPARTSDIGPLEP